MSSQGPASGGRKSKRAHAYHDFSAMAAALPPQQSQHQQPIEPPGYRVPLQPHIQQPQSQLNQQQYRGGPYGQFSQQQHTQQRTQQSSRQQPDELIAQQASSGPESEGAQGAPSLVYDREYAQHGLDAMGRLFKRLKMRIPHQRQLWSMNALTREFRRQTMHG